MNVKAVTSPTLDPLLSPYTFTFDSSSDTHLLTLEAARALLSSQRAPIGANSHDGCLPVSFQ